MDSTVAVHTKGLGSWFHAARNSSMACSRSSTLTNTPRRMRLPVNSPNQRSTRFSQLELVGNEMRDETGVPFEPVLHSGVLVRAVVVHHHMQLQFGGKLRIQALEKLQELLVAMPRIALADHLPLQRPPARRRAWWCRCACSRGSWFRSGPSSAAVPAGCDPGPESGSFHRHRAPTPSPADSDTAPPHR